MNNSGRRVAVPSDRSRLTYPSVIVLSSPESFLWQVAVSRYTQRSNCVVWYTSNHLFVCELDLHKTVAFVFRGALAINYSNQQSLSAAGVRRVLCLVWPATWWVGGSGDATPRRAGAGAFRLPSLCRWDGKLQILKTISRSRSSNCERFGRYEADTKTLSCRCRLFLLFGQDLLAPIGQQWYQVIGKQKQSIGMTRRVLVRISLVIQAFQLDWTQQWEDLCFVRYAGNVSGENATPWRKKSWNRSSLQALQSFPSLSSFPSVSTSLQLHRFTQKSLDWFTRWLMLTSQNFLCG